METLGMLISTAGMIGLFVGLWQWRRASKAKQNTRQPKTITGVSVILFFIGAGLLGSTSLLETVGVLLAVCGGYFLITSIWHLIRSRKTGTDKRRSVIIAIAAAVVFGIGGMMVNASPEGQEEAARSEKVAEQAKAQSAAAESSKKTAAERDSAKIKQDAKKQAKAKALAKSQSRSKAAAKSSRKAVAAAKRAKVAKAAAASSKSIRQAAESSSQAKASSESSAAASSSIAQAAAISSSQTVATSASKAQESAAASSQAAVTETAAQTDNNQQTVYITATGNKYHFDPGCRGLRRAKSVSTTTLAAAISQGYTKCAFE